MTLVDVAQKPDAACDGEQAFRRARYALAKRRGLQLLQRFDEDEPRDEDGKWTDGGGSSSGASTSTGTVASGPSAFVSPNLGHLSFGQAQISMAGERQKMLADASRDIDARLGKPAADTRNVIGAWSDGAENSLLLSMPGWKPGEARVALAMKGYIGDQKAALLFNPDPHGDAFIATFPAKGDLPTIHQSLLDSGLKDHTLEPTSGGGAIVHVYGNDQATVDAIDKAAKDNGTKASFIAGNGEFIGTTKQDGTDREQRDDARKQYEAIISTAQAGSEFAGRDLAKTWDTIRDHWGGKLSQLEQPGSGGGTGSGSAGQSGARSADEAQRVAAKAAAGYPKLEGLPVKPIKVGEQYLVPGPFGKAKAAAEKYMHDAGLSYDPPHQYLKVDPERATRIADAFDQMKHAPNDPAVKASYAALAKEVVAQWHAVKDTGLKVEWIKPGQPDPYAASPRLAAMDVINNNHWWGFPTDLGHGTSDQGQYDNDNPMLQPTDEVVDGKQLVVNDVFRIVHDYFGHFKEGVGFRADGEENAWRSHAAMFTDLARGAMTAETRGQNSWVNFGPYGAANRTANAADTHYAPQKVGVMPKWAQDEGRQDPKASAQQRRVEWERVRARALAHLQRYSDDQPRDEDGKWTDGGGSGGGGDGGTSTSTQDSAASGGKKQAAIHDFAKDAVTIDSETRTDPEKQDKFHQDLE